MYDRIIWERIMEFYSDFLFRIVAALALGFLIGLERELTNKYAGLRTHILVCLGACIFTIVSIYGFPTFAEGDNVDINQATGIRDTARVAAQIVTGIGFIGAGTVLRNGPIIIGLTTAATLWISASIGMTCGVGMYDVAFYATLFSVAVLTLIRIFERKFIPTSVKRTKKIKMIIYCNADNVENIQDYINENIENTEELSVKKLIENPEKVKLSLKFETASKKIIDETYKNLTKISAPDSITIQGINE